MTETKGVIPLITRRINKNINKLTLENYIPSFRAVALFPSQLRRTGEKPRTEQGSAQVVEQVETLFRTAHLLFLASNAFTNILETNV